MSLQPTLAPPQPGPGDGGIGWQQALWDRRKVYFGSWFNSTIMLVLIGLIVWLAPGVLHWGIGDAIWSGAPETCKAPDNGACWVFVEDKFRFMIFGFFPASEQWRPASAMALLAGGAIYSGMPRHWSKRLIVLWAILIPTMYWLMAGGFLGLSEVPTTKWSGLPLTLLLSTVGLAAAFPLGVALALGRRSKLPVIRILSILYIEVIRGVPLISLLFMASAVFPLFMPEGMTIDKVLRSLVAIILFAAAYIAEVVRGGLQAIPDGQYEAAKAMGLSYGFSMLLIILPQSLKIVIPPMVTVFTGFFMDTTLVTIVGLSDFLGTVNGALRDPDWQGVAVVESYLFSAFVYFVVCYGMARYSLFLERYLSREHR